MLKTSLVLTVIGADKPGLVETLSRTVAAHQANWEESRMARLAGQFAGILHLTVPHANHEALVRALEDLEREGLQVVATAADGPSAPDATWLVNVEVVSDDRAGVIRDISRALSELGVNVEELSSEVSSAPMAGGNLFRMHATLRAPGGVTVDRVRSVLEGLADDLMVDVPGSETDAGAA